MPQWGWPAPKPARGCRLDLTHPLARGLVGYWPMVEGSGAPTNLATPAAGTTNAMAWAAAPIGPSGRRGPVLSNPGTTNQVRVPNAPALDIQGPAITYGGWVYPTISNAFQTLLCKDITTTAAGRQYAAYLSSAGTGSVFVGIGGASGFGGNVAVAPAWAVNAWNLVLVGYDGATIRVYVNGKLAGTQPLAGSVVSPSPGGNVPVYMGSDSGNVFPLNGYLDAGFVWNRPLAALEVAALYAGPYQLLRSTVDIAWIAAATATAAASRRTLGNRAGSRGTS